MIILVYDHSRLLFPAVSHSFSCPDFCLWPCLIPPIFYFLSSLFPSRVLPPSLFLIHVPSRVFSFPTSLYFIYFAVQPHFLFSFFYSFFSVPRQIHLGFIAVVSDFCGIFLMQLILVVMLFFLPPLCFNTTFD